MPDTVRTETIILFFITYFLSVAHTTAAVAYYAHELVSSNTMTQYNELYVPVAKVDTDRRLVFGWGQVVTKNGEELFDSDNQSIPKSVALDGWLEFAKGTRMLKQMHAGEPRGMVPFIFPMFDEVLKSLGIEPIGQEGIAVGAYVEDDETLAKFDSGDFTGFSIGGGAAWEDVE